MRVAPLRVAGGKRHRPVFAGALVAVTLGLGGCASGIDTPLPDVPNSRLSTSLTQQEQKQAVEDLTRAGATHEQNAERQIESTR